MDNSSFQQQESDTRQESGFLVGQQIFDSLLPLVQRSVSWLAGLLKLTEKEQEEAGVYLGRLGDE